MLRKLAARWWRTFACLLLLAAPLGSAYALGWQGDAPDIPWSNPSVMAVKNLGKVGGLAEGEDTYNVNYDCNPQTYRLEADIFGTMHTGCFTATAFGQMDIANNVVQGLGFTGAIPVKSFGNQAIIPVPKAAAIATVSGTSPMGSYLHLYTYFPSAVQLQYDWLFQPYLQLPQQANLVLSDSSGTPIIINAQTIAYSSNGSWMVLESPWHSFFRVNTATLDILPFAPSFSPVLDYAQHDSQVAITDDGRYVAIQSNEFKTFKVYDLATCSGDISSSLGPLACSSYNYQPYVSSKISDLEKVRHLRFVHDGLLSFHATTTGDSSPHTYELAPTDRIANLIDYLALGDSYSSGEGAFSYVDGTDTSNNLCHQSAKSYPYLLTNDLFTSAGGHSVACSGAIIEDIVSRDLNYKGQVKDGILRKDRTNSSQILADFTPGYIAQHEFAKKYQPRVMTVGIGGNDIGFVDILEACIEPHARGNTCYASYEDRQELANTIDRAYPKWVEMYRQLQSAAPDTAMYAIGYPHIAQVGGDCGVNVHLNASEVEFAQYLIDYLNTVIEKAATDSGVTYVDISHALDGHKLCEATNASVAMNGLTAGDNVAHIIGNESYHPNALGHELIEQAILHQTHNFTTSSMSSASTSTTPTKINSDNPLLTAPKTGRKVRTALPTKSTTSKVVKKRSAVQLKVSGTSLSLKPNSTFVVSLQGSNTPLGSIATDSNGNIDGQVVIPPNTPGGTDILDISGSNLAGETVDLTETVDVATNENDTDGDGITDATDSCPTVPNIGQDADQDGIDDTCDNVVIPVTADSSSNSGSGTTTSNSSSSITTGNSDITSPSTGRQSAFVTVTATRQGNTMITTISRPGSTTKTPVSSVLGASVNSTGLNQNHRQSVPPSKLINKDNLKVIYWQPWAIDAFLVGLLLLALEVLFGRLANNHT